MFDFGTHNYKLDSYIWIIVTSLVGGKQGENFSLAERLKATEDLNLQEGMYAISRT